MIIIDNQDATIRKVKGLYFHYLKKVRWFVWFILPRKKYPGKSKRAGIKANILKNHLEMFLRLKLVLFDKLD
ncbi:MAG: hypothetical protein A2508_09245 [Candidatus Lambdaproteobacteria bacterium RIFOXYD12_FULL_49_8]|nr:MAG: hypothetical protein A2508_09245 [Candidatus Lambdaproteobacteria bacterium RIFOXYD12_FULL_49_8]